MVHVQKRIRDVKKNLAELEKMEKYFYGSNLLRKADADVSPATPAYSTAPDWVQPVFGRRIWSFLNYEKNIIALIPKARWGQSGWRMLSTAAIDWTHDGTEQPGGIARGGTLPETVAITPIIQATQPKEVIHTWGALEIDQFLSSVDDSVELVPEMRAELGREHAMVLNTQVIQSVEPLAGGAGAAYTGTDNLESLDRIIASNAEEGAAGGSQTDWYNAWMKYAQTEVIRDNASVYDAQVVPMSGTMGTDGDLAVNKIDLLWRQIVEAGGKTDVIITGLDFINALSEILEPERRFIGEGKILPRYGGVVGEVAGVEGGFSVATWKGIPMVTSEHVRCTDGTYGDTISKAYFLDTEFLELRIASPTRYLETSRTYDAYIAQDKLRIEGAYYTVGELICYRFNTQGKLRDIK
ncbi:MAG: hypothetical protein ACXABY_12640 [Candidatus Thorarchaeota archaeon]|jgi:hypothetical protein